MDDKKKLHKSTSSSGTLVYDNEGKYVVQCPTEQEADEFIKAFEDESNSQVEE